MAMKVSKSVDLTGLDKTLEKWNWAKGEQAAMHKVIETCKTEVEKLMLKHGVDELKTDRYCVKKSTQSRESVSKKDLPANLWSKYAKTSTFSVLHFKSLGKMAAAMKAKAKAKAKGKVMKTVKKG
eukprot:TRINITY_DN55311_c0_g1_i1.p2 TRINITY_DN55311_c0_g1~~TRINITY_DN55311_c0_g1_i1.p2  ORF type:complete len:125 (+),score=25.79 TRINITY_DN55311_c0_g1_i1:63-437(+)